MHDEVFDQVIRQGVRSVPRRGVFGLAASLVAVAAGSTASTAKRKKRKKCRNGNTKCGKTCFNLKTDSANCGACGVVCPAGQVCTSGVCGCPAGQSLVAGACIPRFGCRLDLDTCTVGKKACPEFTNESDARCYVSIDGAPFCGTSFTCETITPDGTCSVLGIEVRTFIPCTVCDGVGETGACVRPISQVRP